jgi:hypothetical protein
MAVTLWENAHFDGQKAGPYNFSVSDLRSVAGDFNDKVSSLQIDQTTTFYQNINHSGAHWTLGAGKYDLAALNAHGIPNDTISSFFF